MSVKNAILGSMIGFGISGLTCSVMLSAFDKLNKNVVNNEGQVMTFSKCLKKYTLEKIGNLIVLGSGLYGFYHGYNNNIKMLKY